MILDDATLLEFSAPLDDFAYGMATIITEQQVMFNESIQSLTEGGIIDTILKKIIAFFKDIGRRIVALFRKVFDKIKGTIKSRLAAAEAMGADKSLFTTVQDSLRNAAGVMTNVGSAKTCGELLRNPAFIHPTDKTTYPVYETVGMGKIGDVVKDLEAAYKQLYLELTGSLIQKLAFMNFELAHSKIMTRSGGLTSAEARVPRLFPKWYTGKHHDTGITGANYAEAYARLPKVEADCAILEKGRPGEEIAALFSQLEANMKKINMRFSDPQDIVDRLRKAGNDVVNFHNALMTGALASYKSYAVFLLASLKSVAVNGNDYVRNVTPNNDVDTSNQQYLAYNESTDLIFEDLA